MGGRGGAAWRGGAPALADFWAIYDRDYDLLGAETMRIAAAHPEFAPILATMPPERLAADQHASRERLRQAMAGDWGPYDADLRVQGTAYAHLGITFRGWYDIVGAFTRFVTPRLVDAYGTEPARLVGAISAMQELMDRAMTIIAEAYLATKEAVIRESELRLATTLDSIGDAVIATDTTGLITRMNPVAEQLTGWPAGDAKGRPLAEVFRIVNEQTGVAVESPADRVLREGVVVGLANHTELISRNGTRRPIADSGAPIREVGGETSGVVLVFRDQTEEREAAAEKLRSVMLAAENRRFQEASRLKSEFLANMSHELRTPLNAIIGFTELIHDGEVRPETPQFKEFLGDILASGRHLLQLINDVLDLSKVEAGKLEFRPEVIDLPRLVDEVIAILRTSAAAKRIRVEPQIDPGLQSVVVDGGRLKQVLYNYLSNALKFTDNGGKVIVRARPEPADRFCLEVEDTGVGISTENLPRLFVEFQQLDSGRGKQHGGTGLGLALTRRLVEAQGGSVGVRSAPGKGSTFHAILPRRIEATSELLRPGSFPQPGAPVVLVIEDDPHDQATLVSSLTAAGYAVETAPTGAAALERCATRRFDAITLDLLLPDASGLDILATIRRDEKHRDVPVIVVTVVTERGLAAGFAVHDVLAKPLDAAQLVGSLQRAGVQAPGGTVLVVDDDAGSLRLMAAALRQLGYSAVSAQDGAGGLRFASASPPNAVVLDLLMPEMDGFEFLDRFRELPGCQRVPVVIWSAKDLSREENSRIRERALAVLAKGSGGTVALLDELRSLLPVPWGQPATRRES